MHWSEAEQLIEHKEGKTRKERLLNGLLKRQIMFLNEIIITRAEKADLVDKINEISLNKLPPIDLRQEVLAFIKKEKEL